MVPGRCGLSTDMSHGERWMSLSKVFTLGEVNSPTLRNPKKAKHAAAQSILAFASSVGLR